MWSNDYSKVKLSVPKFERIARQDVVVAGETVLAGFGLSPLTAAGVSGTLL
jgi:hypothetical protein